MGNAPAIFDPQSRGAPCSAYPQSYNETGESATRSRCIHRRDQPGPPMTDRSSLGWDHQGAATSHRSELGKVSPVSPQEIRVKPELAHALRHLQRNILAGIITIGPLFVTYLIFGFLFEALAKAGLPMVHLFAAFFPAVWFNAPWLQSVLAILLTLAVLYVVGRVTSLVVGRQAFGLFESILERLPFVAKVYTSVRQLLDTMMAKKESSQRVVLIDFPIAGQKSIGFLTRTLSDAASGKLLAAVLVPNAINPTSAFLQILPMDRVIETDMTMEQAMSMVMTGGAVGPETIQYSLSEPGKEKVSADGVAPTA